MPVGAVHHPLEIRDSWTDSAAGYLGLFVIYTFVAMCRLTVAMVMFVASLAPLVTGALATVIALRDGDQVLCGGARIWTCDVRAEFTMVERTTTGHDNDRLMLPPDYQPTAPAALQPLPELPSKQAARRDQRDVYLYLDRLLSSSPGPVRIVNEFVTEASGIKLAEVLGSYDFVGVAPHGEMQSRLTGSYPENKDAWVVGISNYGYCMTVDMRHSVLLLTDYPLERDPNPVALLDHFPRSIPHIVLTYSPRLDGMPTPPYLLRQWTQSELVALVQSRGWVVDAQSASWIHMHHRDLPKEQYYMLGTKLVPVTP
jgi:hypothetical protein